MSAAEIDDGGPAFPVKVGRDSLPLQVSENQFVMPGMSLRDYFAARALQGMLTTAGAPSLNGLDGYEDITAQAAYKIANAMIKARTL